MLFKRSGFIVFSSMSEPVCQHMLGYCCYNSDWNRHFVLVVPYYTWTSNDLATPILTFILVMWRIG